MVSAPMMAMMIGGESQGRAFERAHGLYAQLGEAHYVYVYRIVRGSAVLCESHTGDVIALLDRRERDGRTVIARWEKGHVRHLSSLDRARPFGRTERNKNVFDGAASVVFH